MPIKFLSDVAKNDAVVKFLFDHVKNAGVIALILGAGYWKYTNLVHDGWARYFDYFLVVTLYIIGFCLFFINMENINQKVRELEYPRWTKIIFGGLYGVLFLQIIRFLLENKI